MEFFVLLVALIGIALAHQHWFRVSQDFRTRFHQQCRELSIASPDPRCRFDGGVATLVREVEEKDRHGRVLSIERFARNAAGEYFLILSNEPGKPFVKHVTQDMAKVVLGAAYVAP